MPRPLDRARAVCGLALLAVLPAGAVTEVQLSGRSAVNHLFYSGGYAISGDQGEDGAPYPSASGLPVTVTDLNPATLAIAGSDTYAIHYLQASGYLSEVWDQAQTFSLADGPGGAQLHAEGHAFIDQTSEVCAPSVPCGLATEIHRSTNTQALEFTLSAANAYTLNGSTTGGQWIDLLVWSNAGHNWVPVINGPFNTLDRSFSLAGNLAAGLYQLRNKPYTFSGGGVDDVHHSWTVDLLLTGAVAAVPEAPAGWTAFAGLLLLAGWLHRRTSTC